MRRAAWSLALVALAVLPAGAQPIEDTLDFKKLMEKGEYAALGRKLRQHLDLQKSDPRLRRYLEMNLEFLERGAKAAQPGSELILVRGAKNDTSFRMPATSGGNALMLPNSIRYMRTSWDKRLPRITKYFQEATTLLGGDGKNVMELEKILEHHKGGGLGTNANSTKSVLISASTQPLQNFGPPYYILKVAPERAIFNWKGLSGEREVLLPFWVLPTEIVAKCNTYQEVIEHPLYKQSKLKDVSPQSYGYGAGGNGNNWEIIEDNIRNGRLPLEGVAGLNSYFPGQGRQVGPRADADYLKRFIEKVERAGGRVERVSLGDKRLPTGAQARTYLDGAGRPRVLLRRGELPRKIGLLDELTHVHQLVQMIKAQGRRATEEILLRARMGDLQALDVVNRWEIRAKKLIRALVPANDPAKEALTRSIEALEKEIDPYAKSRRGNGTINWKTIGKSLGGGMAHFTLALFLKELALVARTGDRLLLEEFFDGLLSTDFYVHYGLFSLGAAAGDMAYAKFLERSVNRFVRPRFVQSVLRSQVSLAVGMALPDLVRGQFDGRTFALNLGGLGLSSTAVKAGVAGLKWVAPLSRVPGGSKLAGALARANRLRKVGGFVYTAVETAVVLYFGDKISRAVDERLVRRAAEKRVREAVGALLRDPTGEGARERAEAVSAAFRAHRDLLARPLLEAETLLMGRLDKLATKIKQSDDALRRLREADLGTPHLRVRAEQIAAQREVEFGRTVKQALDAYDKSFASARGTVYDERAQARALPSDSAARWILRGQPADEGLGLAVGWVNRISRAFHSRRVLSTISDLPDSRLAAYDHEANLWAGLARAHGDDPGAATYFEGRAHDTRVAKQADHAMLSGKRTGAARTAGDQDATLKGFVDALKAVEGQ
jgi:hypothetical protein